VLTRCGARLWATWLLLLATVSFSASWHHRQWFLFGADELALRAPADEWRAIPVCVEGSVLDLPRELPYPERAWNASGQACRTRFRLRVRRIRSGRAWTAASGVTPVTVQGSLVPIRAGDRVRVWAVLRRVRGPMNPGEPNWRNRLRGDRQLCVLRVPHSECVVRIQPAGWRPATWLGHLRGHCDRILARHLAPERYRLAAAILLGTRGSLTRRQSDVFVRSGTVHLLAISGLHVGIVAGGLLVVARGQLVPRRLALAGVIVLVTTYAALTQGRAPVVRATILVHVLCLGWWTRRRTSAVNSLGAAALVVLARNPNHLFQTGAQLSFLAVATLAALSPHLSLAAPIDPLQRLVWRTRPGWWRCMRWMGRWLGQMAAASFVVWIATVPLVQHEFHLVSPIAVLLNVFLWIPVALVLFSGFGLILCDGICPILATCCGRCCDLNLSVLEGTIERAVRWPLAYAWSSGPGIHWLLLFYLAWSVLLRAQTRRRFWIRCAAIATAWLIIAIGSELAPTPGRVFGVRATFLSVGHGTCVLLEFPHGETLLYDCGRRGAATTAVDTVARFLWSRRVRCLDGVVISHADVDHYNLLPGILERFSIRRAYVAPKLFHGAGPALGALRQQLLASGVVLQEVRAPNRLPIAAPRGLQILHPTDNVSTSHDNANSVVLLVQHGRHLMLLPGDLEGIGLEQLLRQPMDPIDVVMAPHHGSLSSRPHDVIAWSHARVFVVSGADPQDLEVFESSLPVRGCRVLHTAVDGAVEVTLHADRVDVVPYRRGRR
jgi:competence protein ComEC